MYGYGGSSSASHNILVVYYVYVFGVLENNPVYLILCCNYYLNILNLYIYIFFFACIYILLS